MSSAPMTRPRGITVLALFHFLLAAMLLPSGLLWLWILSVLREPGAAAAVQMPSELSQTTQLLFRLGATAGWGLIGFGALKAVIGVGLWGLRNWGRWLAILLAAVAVAASLPGIVASLRAGQWVNLAVSVLFAAGYATILWYMFRPDVRRAFGAAPEWKAEGEPS